MVKKAFFDLKINRVDVVAGALNKWFARNARDLPWRRTSDPYAIWVSEIMLQQTQVKTVMPYWERWMAALPTIESLARAKPETIHKLWEGLGYYTRVRNMQKAAQLIMEKYEGRFPGEYDEVLALPGVGRYTAGAICSIAFDQTRPILDGNVIRVLARFFGIEGDPREKRTNEKLWALAENLVRRAGESPGALNQALMELGALVCTVKTPKCEACPLATGCFGFRKQRVTELPQLPKRAKGIRRVFHAFIVEKRGRFLVRQRPAGVVNAHLWEFPNEEVDALNGNRKELENDRNRALEPFCTIKHSITRYRMTLRAFKLNGNRRRGSLRGRWLRLDELRGLPFTAAHKKVLDQLSRLAAA